MAEPFALGGPRGSLCCAHPRRHNLEEFSQLINAEIKKWAPVVKASGAKVD